MPELPPRAEVIDALWFVVAPAVGAAAVLFGLLPQLARLATPEWRRVAPAAGLLAVAGVLAAVNHFRGVFPWQPDGRWWHWGLPALAGVLLVELVAQHLPRGDFAPLLRGLTAGLVAATVTPPDWQQESRLAVVAVGAVIAAVWAVQLAAGRGPGGALRPLVASVVCFGGAAVLLHHRSLGFADLLNGLGVGLLVLTAVAWRTGTDAAPAAAVATVAAVVLLVMGRALSDSPIPRAAFVLVGATAPLTWLPPRLGRFAGGLTLLLVVGQVAVGVGLAMQAAPLRFGDDW